MTTTHPVSGMTADQLQSRIAVLKTELMKREQELREVAIADARFKVGDIVNVRGRDEAHVVRRVDCRYSMVHYYGATRKKDGKWGVREHYVTPTEKIGSIDDLPIAVRGN